MKNSVIDFLYHTVSTHPDNIAVIDDKESLSFKTLFDRAYRLSKILNEIDLINKPIPVYLPKQADAIVAFIAILISGNIYVPLDIKSPKSRTKNIFYNLNANLIISRHQYLNELGNLISEKAKIILVDNHGKEEPEIDFDRAIFESKNKTDRIIDQDPCYIMHTSGSTGVPKGVVISHLGVIDYIEWAVEFLGIDSNEIIGNQAPLFFDNSTLDIYLSWATGSTLHLIPESLFIFPSKLIDYLEEKRITFIFFVPTVLANISKLDVLDSNRLPELKKVVFAGEVMPAKHLAYWQRHLPDKIYVNLYGPTEITVDCTYFIVDRKYEAHEVLPIGYPCKNSCILILNEDNEEVQNGNSGELCVRGSCLASGYWNAPEITNSVFVQNPLQHAYPDRIYRTGDIVYRNALQQIIYIGRKDHQIKYHGHRIELGEIEKAVLSFGFIDNCCVLYNKEKEEIVIFYESRYRMEHHLLTNKLSEHLPRYMLPKKSYYIEKLPLTPNGKIDRVFLKNAYF